MNKWDGIITVVMIDGKPFVIKNQATYEEYLKTLKK